MNSLQKRWLAGFVLAFYGVGGGCSEQTVIQGPPLMDTTPDTQDVLPADVTISLNEISGGDIGEDSNSDSSSEDAYLDAKPEPLEVVSDVEIVELPPGAWRSALYPEDWSPDQEDGEGRYLHDFSYAGYGNGEKEPATLDGAQIFDVVADFQAAPGGDEDCTQEIQAAIDAASTAHGGVVFFPEGVYRVDGVLRVESSHIVLRGEGPQLSKVFFSASENMDYSGHLRFKGTLNTVVEFPLVADVYARQTYLEVESVEGLSPGDDVQVGWNITVDFLRDHDMEFVWKAFNDTWQPFFHRTVVEVDAQSDPPRVILDVPLRYVGKIRDGLSVRKIEGYLQGVGLEDLALANATDWDTAWEHMQVRLIELIGVKDSWVRNIWSFAPPTAPTSGMGKGAHLQNSGLMVKLAKRVTVADSRLSYAQNRGSGGCGYLFEVRQSSEILFRDCVGRAGRHNFIQNWGFGATGIVWLRVHSLEGENIFSKDLGFGLPTAPDFHHSLATANLIDSSTLDDGWSAVNRGDWSTGAGHSATENVFWNIQGEGTVRSLQYAWGYVIGTHASLGVSTQIPQLNSGGTEPEDYTEGLGDGATIYPSSLYEDQLAKRLQQKAQAQ